MLAAASGVPWGKPKHSREQMDDDHRGRNVPVSGSMSGRLMWFDMSSIQARFPCSAVALSVGSQRKYMPELCSSGTAVDTSSTGASSAFVVRAAAAPAGSAGATLTSLSSVCGCRGFDCTTRTPFLLPQQPMPFQNVESKALTARLPMFTTIFSSSSCKPRSGSHARRWHHLFAPRASGQYYA